MGLNTMAPLEIDFSDNPELEHLSLSFTQVSTLDISHNNKLSFLAIPLNEYISSPEVDQVILDVLQHSSSNNPPGYPRTLDLGMSTGEVALPSSTGLANIDILEDDYGWEVY